MHESSGPSPWPVRAWVLAVRAALLLLAGSAVVLGSTAAASPSSAAVLALGSVGSAALVAAACAAVSAVLVQVLVTGLPSRGAQQRAWTAGSTTIARAQAPGRPGRPQPRAPGAALLPHRAR